jgi:N-carbamoylputrescine amidase
MRIALASPRVAASLDDGLERVRWLMSAAASRGAAIVCFPEAYLPGLRGLDFAVPDFTADDAARVLRAGAEWSRELGIATILGMERLSPRGRQVAAVVFDREGRHLGDQLKTQLDPSEDAHYVPGEARRMFEVDGVRFGIAICHEGWRYPETVRWAARRGAAVVFHPQHTGYQQPGTVPTVWGAPGGAYYEKAMLMRSIENTIYFASVNYALRYPESATSLIEPDGTLQAYLPYGEEGVLVQDIEPSRATGLLARRLAPERYGEER